jgi:GTPase SAR1 family protein
VINLNDNLIITLPLSILALTNLRTINIDSNPLISPPLEIAKQGINTLKYYFESESNSRLKKLEISNKKVLFVGEGEVGKSSLCKSLKGDGQSTFTERTKGVDVHYLELNSGIVSIWDFAGQQDFFSSHNIFTKDNIGRSLFVVVFKLNDNDEVIRHSIKKWTLIAIDQSPRSDIILVGTHLDQVENVEDKMEFVEISASSLEPVKERTKSRLYVNNKLFVSNKTKEGIEEVKTYINNRIQREFSLPLECIEVFEQIKQFKEEQKKEYIFANEIIVTKSNTLNIALTFFHSVGEIIHFINNNTKEIIILNPDWLSKQIAM